MSDAPKNMTFEQAWAIKQSEGYDYGEDALEQVRFGWEIAQASISGRIAELTEDRDYWRASSLAEGKSKLQVRGELRMQESATQQLSAEVVRLQAALDEVTK